MKRFILWCFSLTLFAQVNERLTVVYKDIRVHVLDKDDQPVKGLKLADFVLSEGGKTQEIGFFEEVDLTRKTSESGAKVVLEDDYTVETEKSLEDRYKLLFIDSGQMTQGTYQDVMKAVAEFVDERIDDRDFVKVVHMDGGIKHLTGFTKNKEAVKRSLNKAKYKGRLRRDLLRSQSRIKDAIEYWDQIPPIEQGSYEIAVNTFVKEKARIKADHYRTFYYNMLAIANMLEYIKGPKSIFLFTAGSYLEVNSRYGDTVDDSEKLARTLNRADATIYSVLFKPTTTLGGEPGQLNLRNQRPSFFSALAEFGEFPPNPFASTVTSNTIVENNHHLESGPSAAAKLTGGIMIKSFSSKDIDERIDKMVRVASHYYRLVYPLKKPQKRVKIKIKLKNKGRGWRLVYGSRFEPASSYLDLKERERGIALSAMLLFGQVYRNDLDARWDAHVFAREHGGYRVPMLGSFSFTTAPKKGFELGLAALDENKELLDLTSSVLTELPADKSVSYYDVMLTERWPHYLRVSIRNMDTGDLSFHQMDLPPKKGFKAGETRLSDVLMGAPDTPQPLALNHIRYLNHWAGGELDTSVVEARHREDPLRMDDKYFKPVLSPYRGQSETLWFMFHLERPGEIKYQIQFLIKSGSGVHNMPARIVREWKESARSIHYQGELKTEGLLPGDYMLWIRAVDPATQTALFTSTAFTIGSDGS